MFSRALAWLNEEFWLVTRLTKWYPAISRNNVKSQPSKSTLVFADSNSSRWNDSFQMSQRWKIENDFCILDCLFMVPRSKQKLLQVEKHVSLYLFQWTVEHFRSRVASLTSSPIRLIGTSRYGFTCFDHWFWSRDHSGWFCRVVSLRCDKKKSMVIHILAYLVSWSFQNPVLMHSSL